MDILEFALAQRIGGHDGELVDALCQEVARLREENSRLREVVVVTHEAIDKDLTFFGPEAKKKPTGFVATCQCGVVVGAMDFERTSKHDASILLGKWLNDGCTVEPRFAGTWNVTVEACRCEPSNHCWARR